jgi:TRAP-type C4-dicarboxylate transport system permease small subunit
MQPITFNTELILVVVASLTSLIFSYFPPLADWYAALQSHIKSFIMIALMAVITLAIFLLVNLGYVPSAQPISWQLAVFYFIQAIITNATTYVVSPQTNRVRALKEQRNE